MQLFKVSAKKFKKKGLLVHTLLLGFTLGGQRYLDVLMIVLGNIYMLSKMYEKSYW